MKFHLSNFSPWGVIRACSQLTAGRRLCRKAGASLRPFFPNSVNSMTAAWNFNQTLSTESLRPPRTIIDVGANVSQMSKLLMLSCAPDVKLLSFEPNPNLAPMGEVFHLALSNADGEADFFMPSGDDNWGTIEELDPAPDQAQEKQRVVCARFDTLVAEGKVVLPELPRPILLKIDTEGSELRVLEGFGQTLAEIDLLLIEVSNSTSRTSHYNLLTLAAKLRTEGFSGSKVLYSSLEGPKAPTYMDVLFWRERAEKTL